MYKRLRELRKNNNFNQDQIAKVLNISQNNYSRIENGVQDLSTKQLIKLSKLYKVSADYILEIN